MKKVLNHLLEQPEATVKEVFSRIASFPKLQVLREGLKLFMRHFLLKGSSQAGVAVTLEEQVTVAERALLSGETKMRL